MFLGISSYTFPWAVETQVNNQTNFIAAKELLDYAIQHQISFVQFGDNLPLHSFEETELLLIRELATSNSIGIEVGTRGLDLLHVERYIKLAALFDARFLRIVLDDENNEPTVQSVIDTIRQLIPSLAQNNLVLAIENHDRFPAAVLKKIILQTSTQWVGICLDTANSLGAGEGINELMQILEPYVVNLHLKDIRVHRVAHKMGFKVQGVAAGEGIINMPELIQVLSRSGRCTTATLEVWSDPCSSVEHTILNERELVSKSIQYLKQLLT